MTEIIMTVLAWECLKYLGKKMTHKYQNPNKYE